MANCLDDMSDMDANENQTSYFESILQEDFPMVDCKELLRRRSEELQKFEQEKKFSEVFATVIHDIGYTMLQVCGKMRSIVSNIIILYTCEL